MSASATDIIAEFACDASEGGPSIKDDVETISALIGAYFHCPNEHRVCHILKRYRCGELLFGNFIRKPFHEKLLIII